MNQNYIPYFVALNLAPALASLLFLVALFKGENPKVTEELFLISGMCNAIGFVCLTKQPSAVNKNRSRLK